MDLTWLPITIPMGWPQHPSYKLCPWLFLRGGLKVSVIIFGGPPEMGPQLLVLMSSVHV